MDVIEPEAYVASKGGRHDEEDARTNHKDTPGSFDENAGLQR